MPSEQLHRRRSGTRLVGTRLPERSRSILLEWWQFRRKQVLIVFGMLGILALLLVSLILRVANSGGIASQGATTPSSGSSSIGAPPPVTSNVHELVIVPQDTDHPPPPVLARSAYLLDADTGDTLYAFNPFMHLPMLSTTKLMTASLAVQQGNLDQQITINDMMARDISQLSADSALFGIKKGETYTLRDLLYGLLFVSGNDAAIAIADALGGNLQNFVAQMNQKAQQLGMYDTHFVNPHGLLAPGQYSCAHDLALLGRYSMSLSTLHQISGEKAYHIPQGGNHPERFLLNENQFLWWYPGVDGGKTGYDGQSDFIQVMSVTRNHHHLIGVVMHTNDWWTDMRDLMNWGFNNFAWVSPRDADMQERIPYDSLWNYFSKDTKNVTVSTADGGRYYIYTGYSIDSAIMNYFDSNGGLKSFGYPIRLPKISGNAVQQQFEHATISCNLQTQACQKV